METKRYIVKRDDIQVGNVAVNPELVYQKFGDGKGKLTVNCYTPSRSILFVPSNGYAIDLLYNTPKYPIVGLVSDEELRDSDIVISEPYSLAMILKRLGYREDMNYKELLEFRKRIFSNSFLDKHRDYFVRTGTLANIPGSAFAIERFGDAKLGEVLSGKEPKMDAFKPTEAEKKLSYVNKLR